MTFAVNIVNRSDDLHFGNLHAENFRTSSAGFDARSFAPVFARIWMHLAWIYHARRAQITQIKDVIARVETGIKLFG